MNEEFPFQKAHDAIVSMLHDYLAEKEHAERLESENAILMKRTALLMDEVENSKRITTELLVLCNRQASDIRRLTKAGDAMDAYLKRQDGTTNGMLDCRLQWLAAKEGKQS